MNEAAPNWLFLIFSVLMLVSAAGVVYARNQVYAAMNLVAAFFFLSGDYALLYAHTLAVLQVLVYAGAIVVLFLFVIMLLSLQDTPRQGFEITPMRVLSLLAVLGVAFAVVGTAVGDEFRTKVTRVDGQVVQLESSPFVQGEYIVGNLGELTVNGKTTYSVESIDGEGRGTNHHLSYFSDGAIKVGDEVTLRLKPAGLRRDFGTVAAVGAVMFARYLLPFEAVSLLLLVAIVGAVVVSKGRI